MSKKVTSDDIDKLYQYGIHVPTKTLVSVGDTEKEVAENLMKGLHLLDLINPDMPITIKFNNTGGDEYHGMAIYDSIQACKSLVRVIAVGQIMSMGSVIFQAADERVMMPNGKQMLHYGTPLHADENLHAKEQQAWAAEDKKFSKWMEDMYLKRIQEKHPDYKLKQVIKMLDFSTIINAEESIKLGLADSVFGEEE